MLPRALMNLEVEMWPGGFRVARVSDVSNDLTCGYARSVADAGGVREFRIAQIVFRAGIVVVQMVIKVLIAVVASQKHRVALPLLRSLLCNPVDGTIHDGENWRPLRTEQVLAVMRSAAAPRVPEAARESNRIRRERKHNRQAVCGGRRRCMR